jgi:hypothetical protein
MDERKPCTATDCRHYHSDGSPCIEIGCLGPMGVTVEEMGPHIAGGRKE